MESHSTGPSGTPNAGATASGLSVPSPSTASPKAGGNTPGFPTPTSSPGSGEDVVFFVDEDGGGNNTATLMIGDRCRSNKKVRQIHVPSPPITTNAIHKHSQPFQPSSSSPPLTAHPSSSHPHTPLIAPTHIHQRTITVTLRFASLPITTANLLHLQSVMHSSSANGGGGGGSGDRSPDTGIFSTTTASSSLSPIGCGDPPSSTIVTHHARTPLSSSSLGPSGPLQTADRHQLPGYGRGHGDDAGDLPSVPWDRLKRSVGGDNSPTGTASALSGAADGNESLTVLFQLQPKDLDSIDQLDDDSVDGAGIKGGKGQQQQKKPPKKEENEKTVACLYYCLQCCDCTIS